MSPLPLPPVPEPFQLPFHYGALHHLGVDWLVARGPVRDLLAEHHPDLTAAEFDRRALVSFNYQLYFAQYALGRDQTLDRPRAGQRPRPGRPRTCRRHPGRRVSLDETVRFVEV
ncbi:hypothetical protein AB0I84_28865 [Streptomyces spectabilis]|uniref:hypothetical protein n=1 Tax=Streptomyces spectabilis TaxID=68270 RepID=UPI0033EBB28F